MSDQYLLLPNDYMDLNILSANSIKGSIFLSNSIKHDNLLDYSIYNFTNAWQDKKVIVLLYNTNLFLSIIIWLYIFFSYILLSLLKRM
jgi:hypothetical protein